MKESVKKVSLWFVLLLAAAGCQSARLDCSKCQAGSICMGGRCTHACNTDSECGHPCVNGAAGEICSDGLCAAGCRAGAPVIVAIDGNGEAAQNAVSGAAAHYAGSGLVVTGENLLGTSVTVAGNGMAETPVEIATGSSDTSLSACLPATLTFDTYTLAIANANGESCGSFQLVQGAPGSAVVPKVYFASGGVICNKDWNDSTEECSLVKQSFTTSSPSATVVMDFAGSFSPSSGSCSGSLNMGGRALVDGTEVARGGYLANAGGFATVTLPLKWASSSVAAGNHTIEITVFKEWASACEIQTNAGGFLTVTVYE